MALKLWGKGLKHMQCELVAAFAGVEIEVPPFTSGITSKTPQFLAISPYGKVITGPPST